MTRRRLKQAFDIVPIQQVDIYGEVRRQLLRLIESGDYGPGDRLPSERDLADSLQVSRPIVREALKVLEYAGRVEIRHGAGTFVKDPAPEWLAHAVLATTPLDRALLDHLSEARAPIEVHVTVLAAERGSAEDVERIRNVLRRNEGDHLGDPEIGSLNLLFERAIAEATGNPILMALQRSVHQFWVEAWGALGLAPDDKHRLHAEHLEILAAIEQRDPEAAGHLMRLHVDRSLGAAAQIKERVSG